MSNDRYFDYHPQVPMEIPSYDYFYDEDTNIGYSRILYGEDYFITTQRDVISFRRDRPKYLRTYSNDYGHKYVDISINGVKHKFLVHRLVAEAFIDNPYNYPIVRHLDDNPTNNYVENLAWGTAFDNRQDSIRNDGDYKIPVYCYETDTIYRSGAEAARQLGMSPASVVHACKDMVDSVKGYHICYKDDMSIKLNDPEWLSDKPNPAFKQVIAISPEGEETYYGSRKEAAESIGIPECGISSTIHGTTPHTHGWKFREV